ncbi:MAG: hypothetical protein SNJ84_05330 [Verrucomicrobiia bacterium]
MPVLKILFDHPFPFALAHGGVETQILETKRGLESIGLEVEFFRWWDPNQTGNLIHFFGLPSLGYLDRARAKNIPVVATHLLTATCNRPPWRLRLQGAVVDLLLRLPGWGTVRDQTTWPVLRSLPCLCVGLEAERNALIWAFGVKPERIHLIPLGLADDFLQAPPPTRNEPWLITTGTITQRKHSLELALWAKAARTPLLFVGKPYSKSDPYWRAFHREIDGTWVIHHPHVESRNEIISLLSRARGFVLHSAHENWCLSAHEAAACGLPLLLPDQPWSRERFGDQAHYWPARPGADHARLLRTFYDQCPNLAPPAIRLGSWNESAAQLLEVYRKMLPTID